MFYFVVNYLFLIKHVATVVFVVILGMDTLALVKQHTALAVLLLALQQISSQPFGRQAMPMGPYGNSFHPYLPFYQQMYNPFPAMPFIQPLQPRQFYMGNRMPVARPLLPSRGLWNYPVYRSHPKVLSKPKKRISVFGGPLTNVIPYPTKGHGHMLMKQKKKSRMHSVAKAKSFSGIIKNTALDTGKV